MFQGTFSLNAAQMISWNEIVYGMSENKPVTCETASHAITWFLMKHEIFTPIITFTVWNNHYSSGLWNNYHGLPVTSWTRHSLYSLATIFFLNNQTLKFENTVITLNIGIDRPEQIV